MIEVTLDTKEFDQGVARMIGQLEDPKPVLMLMGRKLQEQTARRFREQREPNGSVWYPLTSLALSTRPGGGVGGKTLWDTGGLMRSITSSNPALTNESVTIGSNLPYAAIHQHGGTIRPKTARNLAIPLTREARRAGRARRWWKEQTQKERKPFVLPTRSGRAIIATSGRGGKVNAHWLLLKSVTIPARPYLGVSADNWKELSDLVIGHFEHKYGGRA